MKWIFIIIFLISSLSVDAQDELNLQSYTPSVLISKGHWEFKLFQNLYTQTRVFDTSGKSLKGQRQSWLTSINQFNYGINDKVNIGADLWVKHVNFNGTQQSRTAVSGFGPKIKFTPSQKIKRLAIQSTVLFPLAKDLESNDLDNANKPFLDKDRTLWINELYYDTDLDDKLQLFLRFGVWYSFARDSFRKNNYAETPISAFVSFFPDTKITLYFMTEYAPTHYNDQEQTKDLFNTYYIQSGLGLKYQLIAGKLEAELLYTDFWTGSLGNGAGQTFNLGLRIIR